MKGLELLNPLVKMLLSVYPNVGEQHFGSFHGPFCNPPPLHIHTLGFQPPQAPSNAHPQPEALFFPTSMCLKPSPKAQIVPPPPIAQLLSAWNHLPEEVGAPS